MSPTPRTVVMVAPWPSRWTRSRRTCTLRQLPSQGTFHARATRPYRNVNPCACSHERASRADGDVTTEHANLQTDQDSPTGHGGISDLPLVAVMDPTGRTLPRRLPHPHPDTNPIPIPGDLINAHRRPPGEHHLKQPYIDHAENTTEPCVPLRQTPAGEVERGHRRGAAQST